jgi:hypothetical protein
MKILLIAEKDSTKESVSTHLAPRGFDLIHYRNPIKAMDNIDEIAPEVVFFSAEDFPRHWKPFLKLLRESFTKDTTTFVLLKGDIFPFEEAAKAKHLEVAGIIKENLEDRKEYSRLEELLSRYTPLNETRRENRYIPGVDEDVALIFTHPENHSIITGSVFDLSATGAALEPDNIDAVKDLPVDLIVERCSLKIEDRYFSFPCKVIRNEERIAFQFLDLDDSVVTAIKNYIAKKPERELHNALQSKAADT